MCRGRRAGRLPRKSRGIGGLLGEYSRRAAERWRPLTPAERRLRRWPTTARIWRSGAACFFVKQNPSWGQHRTESRMCASTGMSTNDNCRFPTLRLRSAQAWLHVRYPLLAKAARKGASYSGQRKAENFHALPLIFAHHQRTPTNRNRQSLRNSGGLPSKAWPMNWRIHPVTNSASA
jgi:hypothetical protein